MPVWCLGSSTEFLRMTSQLYWCIQFCTLIWGHFKQPYWIISVESRLLERVFYMVTCIFWYFMKLWWLESVSQQEIDGTLRKTLMKQLFTITWTRLWKMTKNGCTPGPAMARTSNFLQACRVRWREGPLNFGKETRTGLQGRNTETDVENKRMDTKLGGMNWEIGINIYTLICIK